MSVLDALTTARAVVGPARLARLRDAAEAIGDELRATPIRAAHHVTIDRVLVETRTVLPDARLVSPLVALVRRALLLVAADGTRILVDPSDAGAATPYEERIASRHPVALRALTTMNAPDATWPSCDLVVSTSLALRSIARARTTLGKVRWIASRAEIAAAHDPAPLDRARYARSLPSVEAVDATQMLAPGVAMLSAPGPTAGHAAIAFCLGGHVHVHTHAGVVVDAWSPYESSIPGLREAVRLRNVETVLRGDASDPTTAVETMAIERALADRRADKPAMFRVLPGMELGPTVLMPRIRPVLSTLDS